MSQEDAAGGDVVTTYLQKALEHPLVWDYVGKGRYLQVAVSKSVLHLYVSKFNKSTTRTLTNWAAECGSLSLLEWSRGPVDPMWDEPDCVWDESVFMSSAKGGHVELMLWLMGEGQNIHVRKDARACAAAAGGGHTEAIKWLRCCDFPWDADTCTAASRGGHLEMLIWARFQCSCPWDSLEVCKVAARNNHLHILVEMLARGVQPTSEVCVAASEGGNLAILRWLREKEIPWDGKVCWAGIERGSIDILRYALDNKCPWSPHDLMPSTHDTPFHIAARKDYTDIAAFLLEKLGRGGHSVVNLANAKGETALSLASKNGSLRLVKLLVLAGANVEAADLEGRTPLYWSVPANNVELVAYLIDVGAKVNTAGLQDGFTPLHVSAAHNCHKVALLLIKQGAELNRKGHPHQCTALHVAVARDSLQVAKVLIDKGADVNTSDSLGCTVLHTPQCGSVDRTL